MVQVETTTVATRDTANTARRRRTKDDENENDDALTRFFFFFSFKRFLSFTSDPMCDGNIVLADNGNKACSTVPLCIF